MKKMRLLQYSLASTAFMGLVGEAKADVVYTDVDPDAMLTAMSLDIDFNGDGTAEFTVGHGSSSSTTSGVSTSAKYGYVSAVASTGAGLIGTMMTTGASSSSFFAIKPLSSGYGIGPAVTFGDTYGFHGARIKNPPSGTYSTVGSWAFGTEGYIGVTFQLAGSTHYGWIRCIVGNNYESITVLDYAYESTPDQAIAAGAMPMASSIEELVLNGPVSVYSNGSNLIVSASGALSAPVEISVHDLSGRLLATERFTGDGILSSDKWQPGDILIVTSRWGRKQSTVKLLVQ